MSRNCCKFCGEHILDCDCEENQPWYCFDDIKPSPGQKCLIKSVQIHEAYYSPRAPDEFCAIKLKEVGGVTAWRPLFEG
jgi:hypothetical protein